MGVLEFFGSLTKHNITSSAIKINYANKMSINHLFLDFNSIIHVSGKNVVDDINIFMELILKNIYDKRSISTPIFTEKFNKYKMQTYQSQFKADMDPKIIIHIFAQHFTTEYVDKLIITDVINTILYIIRTYCVNTKLNTLLLAIDGVPSKGKMVEQRQRRYTGAIAAQIETRIFTDYTDYLLAQPNYIYLANANKIQWSRNKITPGTEFMHKLVNYLKSEKIQSRFRVNRKQLNVIVSDMYEIGEGEKKIVNYITKFLKNTHDTIVVYSPDADMILLCMLMPVNNLHMLRYNQQTALYDIIDINMLKKNISFYINNNPNYSHENFDTAKINNDIVCLSTLFGNDFVPKIESINVKKGFQNIMDSYLKTLLKFKQKNYYLIMGNNHYTLNFTFLKCVLKYLLPSEEDFIKNNLLYNKYINIGQIKNIFDYMEINSENIISTYTGFVGEYNDLKNAIKNNGNLYYFETHNQFIGSLKKCLNVVVDNQVVNTTYLRNVELIKLLQNYYSKNREFPKLSINLNTFSHSITDQYHANKIRKLNYNDYQKQLYKFRNMLDEYYIKFNAQPLQLTINNVPEYYEKYFDTKLYHKNGTLTNDANAIMHDYLTGLLWVFDYYYNDKSYINTWYYRHDRAPLLTHFVQFLDSIDSQYFENTYNNLKKYHVYDLNNYFNPINQLIYVSPLTTEIKSLLPKNYRDFININNMNPFLNKFFINVDAVVNSIYTKKVCTIVDCHSIIYFNKCLIKPLIKPTHADDKEFLKLMHNIKPTSTSIMRSKNTIPFENI